MVIVEVALITHLEAEVEQLDQAEMEAALLLEQEEMDTLVQ